MNIDAAFPSKYIKAHDLKGIPQVVVMDRVDMEEVQSGEDPLPVLYFQNRHKGLVLNKTNKDAIKAVYGPETENWFGHQIELFEAQVSFQGRTTTGVRVRVVPVARAHVAAPIVTPQPRPYNGAPPSAYAPVVAPTPPPHDHRGGIDEDSIPFAFAFIVASAGLLASLFMTASSAGFA